MLTKRDNFNRAVKIIPIQTVKEQMSQVQTFVKPYTIFSAHETKSEEMVEERSIEPLSPEVYYD